MPARKKRQTVRSKASRTEEAYQYLQLQILRGNLAAGSVLSESRLAKELGFSRTPVGEAIKQLAHEGLVEQIPRFGTIVRKVEWNEIEELYELREALESYAAGRAAERISSSQIAQLELLCQRIEQIADELQSTKASALEDEALHEFLAADMAFHLLIVRASGNQRILKVIRETRTISQIFRIRREPHDWQIVRRACNDHARILDALRRHDGEAAMAAMTHHIRDSKSLSLNWIREHQPAAPISPGLYLELPESLANELRRLENSD